MATGGTYRWVRMSAVQLSESESEGDKGKFVRSGTQTDKTAWDQMDKRSEESTVRDGSEVMPV